MRFLFIWFATLSLSANASTKQGCVASWNAQGPVTVEVALDLPNENVLQNSVVSFSEPPADLIPQAGPKPWCFLPTDPRFAYVQTFYYVTRQIRRFEKWSGVPFHRMQFQITFSPGEMPAGGSEYGTVLLHTPTPAVDPSTIAHEMGHEIQDELIGKDVTEVLIPHIQANEWRTVVEQMGVIEGTANLLSAFQTGNPTIGAATYADAAISVDSFVRFPDLPISIESGMLRYENAPGFRALYPKTVELMSAQLRNPTAMLKATKAFPDPYLSSAAFNQPLWQAAVRFGFGRVEGNFLQALKGYTGFQSYADFAQHIEATVQGDPELRSFLQSEFAARGL